MAREGQGYPHWRHDIMMMIIIIIIFIILLPAIFSPQRQLMVFHASTSDSKFPQISRTLLSILADLSNAVIWMVSDRPPISNFSSPLTKPLGIVPSAPFTIGITVTFMFHSFFFAGWSFFLVIWQGSSTFCCLWFSLCGLPG